MEEVHAEVTNHEATEGGAALVDPSQESPPGPPAGTEAPCPTCGGPMTSMPVSHVYAIGRIEPGVVKRHVDRPDHGNRVILSLACLRH